MSAHGMTKTILATELANAVRKDDAVGHPPFEIGHGRFGPAVTEWIGTVAQELGDRAAAGR